MAEADAMGTEWSVGPHEGIEPQPGDIVLRKQRVSAFHGGAARRQAACCREEKVLVSRELANLPVESTIRGGADLADELTLAAVACSSFDDAWHRTAVEFAVTRLSEFVTVDEVVAAVGHTRRLDQSIRDEGVWISDGQVIAASAGRLESEGPLS